jgi:polyhydroxybutyrate depolymerase
MYLQRRSSGFALVTLATFALSMSCGSSGSSPSGTGGGSPAGSAGVSDAAGATGGAGATGNAGTMGAAGSSGTTGTAGSVGDDGGGASGNGGAGGGPDAGGGGAAGTGAAGTGGTADSGTMPTTGCGKPAGLMSGRASIDVAGKTREYILAVPNNYDQNRPYRLIFGWHPWGGSAQQIANGGYFGLSSVINGQAILVAPEGQDFQNNGLGWGNVNGEDIAFFHAMVDRFSAQLCIDQNRIFSTGFSFGAMFSFTLACTEMSMMRAIAPMAGNATTSGRCENSTRSVATMAFIGVDDTLLPGHRQAVQIFVERNGCSAQTMAVQPSWCDGLGSSYQPCTCVEYQGCKTGYPVISCEYKAGHRFAPSAGATLWNFFSQF